MPRPRKTDRVYLPHNVVPPAVHCAWCKIVFQLSRTQLKSVLTGRVACCSAKCSGPIPRMEARPAACRMSRCLCIANHGHKMWTDADGHCLQVATSTGLCEACQLDWELNGECSLALIKPVMHDTEPEIVQKPEDVEAARQNAADEALGI